MNSELSDKPVPPSLLRAIMGIYGFACAMVLIVFIPGCNMGYSLHGGPAWFLLPFVFPYVLVRVGLGVRKGGEIGKFYSKFAKISIPIYLVVSIPIAYIAADSLKSLFGYEMNGMSFYKMLTLPLSIPFFLF